jgi:hypothetical protein
MAFKWMETAVRNLCLLVGEPDIERHGPRDARVHGAARAGEARVRRESHRTG